MSDTYQQPIATRKVTMNLPVDLIDRAPEYLGKSSLTEAVRDTLREALHRQACQELMDMRGKVKLDIDLKALRNDD